MAANAGAMTIQEQIAYGNALKISNSTMNYQKVLAINSDNLVINFESILTDYRYFLDKHISVFTMTDAQYLTYRFKPKSLSYDLYGTIEYASLLLVINHIVSVSEFDFKTLNIFDDQVKTFLNEVLNKEKAKISANTSAVNADLT